MAEGGACTDRNDEIPQVDLTVPRVELVDSLELLFSRDFLTHVIRRKIPGWTFGLDYGTSCPCTPFSFKIRQYVDFYLTKHHIDLYYFMFRYAFNDQPLDYNGFINAVNLVVQTTFPSMQETHRVLKLLCLYGIYTTRALEAGIGMAPYYALIQIQGILSTFIRRKRTIPDHFFGQLPNEAKDLIAQDSAIQMFDKFGFYLNFQ